MKKRKRDYRKNKGERQRWKRERDREKMKNLTRKILRKIEQERSNGGEWLQVRDGQNTQQGRQIKRDGKDRRG